MAKVKPRTHKGASKRFKITATGKVLHRVQGSRHLKSSKSTSQKRNYLKMRPVKGAIAKKIKRSLALI